MHRRVLLFAAPALLLTTPAWAVLDEAGFRALNKALLEGAVLPGYRAFASATAGFAGTLAALGKAPADAATIAAARRGWNEAMVAWEGIQHIRFGPVDLFSRHQRIQFWPDPQDSVGHDLAEAISRRDASLLEVRPNALTNITLLGLPAAERLLFGQDAAARLAAADAEAAYRAALLGAIGATLAGIGRDMLESWMAGDNPYAAVMVEPRMPYATPKAATLDLFKALYAAVEAVSGRKLDGALAAGTPLLLEFWRGAASGPALVANIAAARQMFRAGFGPALTKDGQGELAGLLDKAFELTSGAAAALDMPIEDALAEPAGRARLQVLQREAVALKLILSQRVPPVLDIPLGFNALDGG